MSNKKRDFFEDLSEAAFIRFREEHFCTFASAYSTRHGNLRLGVLDGEFCVDTEDRQFTFDDPQHAIDKFKELYNQKEE